MRQILIFVSVCFCLLACKKETTNPSAQSAPSALFGKWELRNAYGGPAGQPTVFQPGNGDIYLFNSDGTYAYFLNGVQVGSGTFRYEKNGYDAGNGIKYDEIFFGNGSPGEILILNGTQLTIRGPLALNPETVYAKVADQ